MTNETTIVQAVGTAVHSAIGPNMSAALEDAAVNAVIAAQAAGITDPDAIKAAKFAAMDAVRASAAG